MGSKWRKAHRWFKCVDGLTLGSAASIQSRAKAPRVSLSEAGDRPADTRFVAASSLARASSIVGA